MVNKKAFSNAGSIPTFLYSYICITLVSCFHHIQYQLRLNCYASKEFSMIFNLGSVTTAHCSYIVLFAYTFACMHSYDNFYFSVTGIVVGFNDQLLQVTEGVNASIEVCGFLNSSTGIWKSNLSVTVVISNATATGLSSLFLT